MNDKVGTHSYRKYCQMNPKEKTPVGIAIIIFIYIFMWPNRTVHTKQTKRMRKENTNKTEEKKKNPTPNWQSFGNCVFNCSTMAENVNSLLS